MYVRNEAVGPHACRKELRERFEKKRDLPFLLCVCSFTKVSHLVTKNHIVFDAPVKGCKTSDNVTVVIDTSLVFRVMGDAKLGEKPELVRQFVHQVREMGRNEREMGRNETYRASLSERERLGS